ncbi:hypothetical protein ACFQU7_00940 [Pseudoroseomonas wenyumeiae]
MKPAAAISRLSHDGSEAAVLIRISSTSCWMTRWKKPGCAAVAPRRLCPSRVPPRLSANAGRRCGERMAQQLESLLARARAEAATAAGQPDEWFWVAREMHVEWIARVVSVILLSHGQRPILPPSREAAMEAARLIGLPVS